MTSNIRILLSCAVIVLLCGILILPQTGGHASNALSSTCSSSQTLTMTMFGGAPNSFNALTAAGVSAFVPIHMEYPYGIYPLFTPDGTLDWNTSLLDSISSNSNYTTWTFNVKPGLYWSNGQQITAQDIKNTYSSQFALNSTYDFQGLGAEITGESVVNSSTIIFSLNQSDAHFPLKMSEQIYTPIYPVSFIHNGAASQGFGTNIADGPFYVANYTSGQTTVTMLRNPYFKPEPKACELIINFVESESSTATYLESGTTDLAPIVQNIAPSIASLPNTHIFNQKDGFADFLYYYIQNYPYNMTAFRQALIYGINESEIVQKAFGGYGTTAYTSEGGVPQDSFGYSSNQTTYTYDVNKSISLLKSIGITKGSDGYLQYPNGTDINIPLWVESTLSGNLESGTIIQNSLEALGFKVTVNTLALGTMIGYTYRNVDNIKSGLIAYTSSGVTFGDPYLDGQPAYNVFIPMAPRPNWEYPPALDAQYNQYNAKLTATDNVQSELSYLSQIQYLNSQVLPIAILAYPSYLFAYSSQHWTNWPTGRISYFGYAWNVTAFALLQPAGTSSSASQSTAASSSTTASSLVSTTGSSVSTATTLTSVSSTAQAPNNSSGLSSTIILSIVAVIIIIVAAAAVLLFRRRSPGT